MRKKIDDVKKTHGGRQMSFSLMKKKKKHLMALNVALIDNKGINDLMATKCPSHP